eukprot:jgi/Mesvir1/1407/Mv14408-RA.2
MRQGDRVRVGRDMPLRGGLLGSPLSSPRAGWGVTQALSPRFGNAVGSPLASPNLKKGGVSSPGILSPRGSTLVMTVSSVTLKSPTPGSPQACVSPSLPSASSAPLLELSIRTKAERGSNHPGAAPDSPWSDAVESDNGDLSPMNSGPQPASSPGRSADESSPGGGGSGGRRARRRHMRRLKKHGKLAAPSRDALEAAIEELEVQDWPACFLCPLTGDVMTNPYITPDGTSYEREAIERHVAEHGTHPATEDPLCWQELYPNRALKQATEEYLDAALAGRGYQIPFAHLQLGRRVAGSVGTSKEVFEGRWRRWRVAVLSLLPSMRPAEPVSFLARLWRHPRLLRVYAESVDPASRRQVIVTELSPYGPLDALLRENKGRTTLAVRLELVLQIADASAQLAALGLHHRRMAARNVLVFDWHPSLPSRVAVKVADYGISRKSALLDGGAVAWEVCASPRVSACVKEAVGRAVGMRHMPPETLALAEETWTEKAFVWAFAVTAWEVLAEGAVPYGESMEDSAVVAFVCEGGRLPAPPGCPMPLYEVLLSCMASDPSDRPSFAALLPVLTQVCAGIQQEQAAAALAAGGDSNSRLARQSSGSSESNSGHARAAAGIRGAATAGVAVPAPGGPSVGDTGALDLLLSLCESEEEKLTLRGIGLMVDGDYKGAMDSLLHAVSRSLITVHTKVPGASAVALPGPPPPLSRRQRVPGPPLPGPPVPTPPMTPPPVVSPYQSLAEASANETGVTSDSNASSGGCLSPTDASSPGSQAMLDGAAVGGVNGARLLSLKSPPPHTAPSLYLSPSRSSSLPSALQGHPARAAALTLAARRSFDAGLISNHIHSSNSHRNGNSSECLSSPGGPSGRGGSSPTATRLRLSSSSDTEVGAEGSSGGGGEVSARGGSANGGGRRATSLSGPPMPSGRNPRNMRGVPAPLLAHYSTPSLPLSGSSSPAYLLPPHAHAFTRSRSGSQEAPWTNQGATPRGGGGGMGGGGSAVHSPVSGKQISAPCSPIVHPSSGNFLPACLLGPPLGSPPGHSPARTVSDVTALASGARGAESPIRAPGGGAVGDGHDDDDDVIIEGDVAEAPAGRSSGENLRRAPRSSAERQLRAPPALRHAATAKNVSSVDNLEPGTRPGKPCDSTPKKAEEEEEEEEGEEEEEEEEEGEEEEEEEEEDEEEGEGEEEEEEEEEEEDSSSVSNGHAAHSTGRWAHGVASGSRNAGGGGSGGSDRLFVPALIAKVALLERCPSLGSWLDSEEAVAAAEEGFHSSHGAVSAFYKGMLSALGMRGLSESRLGVELSFQYSMCAQHLMRSTQMAMAHLLFAARMGHAAAQHALSLCYQHGDGVEEDVYSAIKWCCKASEGGIPGAMCHLASCYMAGEGVDMDMAEGFRLYERAAQMGLAEAMFRLGSCYDVGEGVAQDLGKAWEWYLRAGLQGHPDAMFRVGCCLHNGDGVEADAVKAVEWYRKAALQGHAGAQCNLGLCYRKGDGVPLSPEDALYWFTAAADSGNAGAMANLGLSYVRGDGLPLDMQAAITWFMRAIEHGSAVAMFQMGLILDKGDGIRMDKDAALMWIRRAANAGLADAQYVLGMKLFKGMPAPDKKAAVLLWKMAADQGHPQACAMLQSLSGPPVGMPPPPPMDARARSAASTPENSNGFSGKDGVPPPGNAKAPSRTGGFLRTVSAVFTGRG